MARLPADVAGIEQGKDKEEAMTTTPQEPDVQPVTDPSQPIPAGDPDTRIDPNPDPLTDPLADPQ